MILTLLMTTSTSIPLKKVEKIKATGKVAYYKRKKYCCPYCTTKQKPKDKTFEHLLSHERDASRSGEDAKITAQHAALLKAFTPI